jgi:hypothetical protein
MALAHIPAERGQRLRNCLTNGPPQFFSSLTGANVIARTGGATAYDHAAIIADGNLGMALTAVHAKKERGFPMYFVRHLAY